MHRRNNFSCFFSCHEVACLYFEPNISLEEGGVLLKFHAKIKVKTPTYNFDFFVKPLDHDMCTIKTGFIYEIHTIYYRHYHKKSKLPINKATDYAGAA